jgi:hypothetical protein
MTSAHGGGCLCGALRYEFTSPAKWVGYCHCQSCRRNTGAPMAAFVGLLHGQFRALGLREVNAEGRVLMFDARNGGSTDDGSGRSSYVAWPSS